MRTSTRTATLLAALTLLLTAIPVLDCCFGRGWHPAAATAHVRTHGAPSTAVLADSDPTIRDPAARGCTDHAAPTQTPYIETGGGSGGSPASTRSTADASADPASPSLAAAFRYARLHGISADATGPPLWLTTCVSRT